MSSSMLQEQGKASTSGAVRVATVDGKGVAMDQRLVQARIAKQQQVGVGVAAHTTGKEDGGHGGPATLHDNAPKIRKTNETPSNPAMTEALASANSTSQGFMGSMPMPMPNLQRGGNHPQPEALPGAFGMGGGADRGGNPLSNSYTSQGNNNNSQQLRPDPPNNEGLAVAAPVTDDEPRDLENARPVLPENDESARKRKETNFLVVIGSLCVIALMMFLIIYFVVESEEDGSQHPSNENKNNSSITTATGTPGNVTSAPRNPTEHLMDLLPNYTKPKLEIYSSPQAKAFQWLTGDPNFQTYNEKRLQQRFALAAFYFSTNGDGEHGWGNQTNWLNHSIHECHWDYSMPDNRQYHLGPQYRHFEYKYIDGPCVPSNESMVANFSEAMDVSVYDDYLYLAMAGQKLEREIPPEITMLSSLQMIQLESTTLEGTIPTILANITSLRQLHLFWTAFSGTLPSELGMLTELRTLEIGGSEEIYGTLPTEYGLLSNMESFVLSETNVTGTIPLEYAHGLNPYDFKFHQNRFTGTIPSELGLWSSIEWLLLDSNDLTGTIPTELGALENVIILYLWDNHLLGTIPTELGFFSHTRQIYLNMNELTGTIPTELGQQGDAFWRLRVDDNHLTGTVPSELGTFTMCHSFGIHDNLLSGTVPTEFANMFSMQYFRLKNNHLTGSFPAEFFYNTSRMVQFWLENNDLTGTIPSEIGNWETVSQVKVEGNGFTGSLPSELGNLRNLQVFLAGSNQFTGHIPSELGNALALEKLREISVENNLLTGRVPSELGLLNETLTHLNLTGNDGLFGTLPDEICFLEIPSVLEFHCGGDLCGCDCPCDNVTSSNGFVLYGQDGSVLTAEAKAGGGA